MTFNWLQLSFSISTTDKSVFILDSSCHKWVLALVMCKTNGANVVKSVGFHAPETVFLLPWKMTQDQLGGNIG